MQTSRVMAQAVAVVATCAACAQADVEGPYDITGHDAAGAYFYVVPVGGNDVVLVDSGSETEGDTLKSAVADRRVLGVLITHSHNDHTAGAHVLGDVPVFVGREDLPTLLGERDHRGLAPSVLGRVMGSDVTLPTRIEPVDDGHEFYANGETFHAIAMPGHTPGSMAWLYRDVLFSGDAAVKGAANGVTSAPMTVFSDRPAQARESIHTLRNVEFTTMLDGHRGRLDDAKDQLPTRY